MGEVGEFVAEVETRAEEFWFVVWTCKCTDVEVSPEALDPTCPHHDGATAMEGTPVRVPPDDLGHLCADGKR